MTRTEAESTWMQKLNEPASQNTFLNCAEDKERGMYWIQYENGDRFEFEYEPRVRICEKCGSEIGTVYIRCASCQDVIIEKRGA